MDLVREAKAMEAAKKETKPALPPTKTAVFTDPAQCQATTKSGRQCRNKALGGSDFCQVHQP